MLRYVNIKSNHRSEFIDITDEVQGALSESDIKSGVCVLYVPHTTAAVTINEGADPAVRRDMVEALTRLVPHEMNYAHREGNSDAHIKASLLGASEHILIEDGELVLGTWQSIYFCEFDGPRHRRLAIKFIRDA